MYTIMRDLLDSSYPEQKVTVTASDPPFITPNKNALMRRKNWIMHTGRVEEAGALSERVRTLITRRSSKWLNNIDIWKNSKDVWSKVNEVPRGTSKQRDQRVDGITAQELDDYYATISTDLNYRAPF
jgi:hypothetical protein